MRRRRRRSGFSSSRQPQSRYVLFGGIALVVIGAFLFFMRQSDELAPEPRETRIELPDAFKE